MNSNGSNIGHALFVAGGISAMVGFGGSCYQLSQYDLIVKEDIYCDRNMRDENKCNQLEEAKKSQHKLFGVWASISIASFIAVYAGRRMRDRQ